MINDALLQLLYMGVTVVIIDVVNQSTAVQCYQSQTDVSGCMLAVVVSVTRRSATDRLHYLPTVAPPPLPFCFFIEIKVQLDNAGLQTKNLIKEPLAPIGGKKKRCQIILRATQQ